MKNKITSKRTCSSNTMPHKWKSKYCSCRMTGNMSSRWRWTSARTSSSKRSSLTVHKKLMPARPQWLLSFRLSAISRRPPSISSNYVRPQSLGLIRSILGTLSWQTRQRRTSMTSKNYSNSVQKSSSKPWTTFPSSNKRSCNSKKTKYKWRRSWTKPQGF